MGSASSERVAKFNQAVWIEEEFGECALRRRTAVA
jgi:hypothetical protein